MNFDPRTLLFSLILSNTLMALSLFFAASNRGGKRDGIGKWTAALLFETLAWVLIASRGNIPEIFSVVVANGLIATAHGLILAAIFEFQQRRLPHWTYLLPVSLTLVMAFTLLGDINARFIWGGLIYSFQMLLIARALLFDGVARAGRAWRLLLGGVVLMLLVLMLRAASALAVHVQFAQPQNAAELLPVQVLSFIAVMAASLLGSVGFVLMLKERTDQEIMHLAMTDSLTRIPNRRALMERAKQALARRNGDPLALLMIDVDHFKLINDTHGHPAGDEVLYKVAGRLSERLRAQDLLGRYGGEEFCIVAPDTGRVGALKLAESIRAAIVAMPFDIGNGHVTVTVSIGIALCSTNASRELKDVLAEADSALYTAKKTGRNKVVCFNDV